MKSKRGQGKKFLKDIWHLLWKDDSLKGWIFSVVFIVIFILFIFFPILRFVTGTSLPLAIVESCSMYHQGNLASDFDAWWERHDSKYLFPYKINSTKFQEFIFKNGFNKGDILFIIRANPEKIKVGDVIIFESGIKKNPIIHRIVKIQIEEDTYIFSTMGDNNDDQWSFEKEIKSEQLIGKAVFKLVPYFGWAKLIFYEHLRIPSEKGFCGEN